MIFFYSSLGVLATAGFFIIWLLDWVREEELPQNYLPPQPPSLPGLWFMAHRADRKYGFQHLFIRITPHNSHWQEKYPELFANKDDAGRFYCTLGAGPKEGKLFLEFNRRQDLGDPVSFMEKMPAQQQEEDRIIIQLLESFSRYDQMANFNAWPPFTGLGYNCNSMNAALCRRAKINLPHFSEKFMLCPGTERPVGEGYFKG